ncbi:MAG: TonB-dependent receptor [Leadbetterella sp.]
MKNILLLFFILLNLETLAQNLNLRIRDNYTQKPLENASVVVDYKRKAQGYLSDKEGLVSIPNIKEENIISVKYLGYVPVWLESSKLSKKDTTIIFLKPVAKELEQVIISAKSSENNFRKPLLGVSTIDIKTLKKIPAAFGEVDFLRSIQMLPGVSSVGEASNGVNIRGGTTDQNLLLVDDAPIFNPTHMFGLFSVLPPDAIRSIDLYKGNVPARFGSRSASVIDIAIRNPDLEKIQIHGGVSFITGKLQIETPIVKNKLAILVSTRASYSDFILPKVSDQFEDVKTSFNETLGKLLWRINDKNTFTSTNFFSQDYFQTNLLATLPNVIGYATFFEHETFNSSNKWVRVLSPNSDISTQFVYANYTPTIGTIETENDNKVRLNSGVLQRQGKINYNYETEKKTLEVGLSFCHYTISPGSISPGVNNTVNPQTLPVEKSLESAVFADYEVNFSKRFSISTGLRYSYFGQLGPFTSRIYTPGEAKDDISFIDSISYSKGQFFSPYSGLEPRIGIKYLNRRGDIFKIGFNTMRQYIQIVSNTTTPIPTSRWKTSDQHIKPQISYLWSAGYYRTFNSAIFEFSSEVYYRLSQNIADYKPGADFLLQPYPETQLVQGVGRAYGMEFMLSKKKGNFKFWANYTYARAINQVYQTDIPADRINSGNPYRANYDRPHSFNTSLDFTVDEHNSFDFNFVLSSGRPYTQPLGFISYQNNFYPFYNERNNERVPTYHRLDFSWNIYNPSMKKSRYTGDWSFSIYNVYARKNAYSIFFKTEDERVRAYKLQVFGAPIVSLAYNFRFQ